MIAISLKDTIDIDWVEPIQVRLFSLEIIKFLFCFKAFSLLIIRKISLSKLNILSSSHFQTLKEFIDNHYRENTGNFTNEINKLIELRQVRNATIRICCTSFEINKLIELRQVRNATIQLSKFVALLF